MSLPSYFRFLIGCWTVTWTYTHLFIKMLQAAPTTTTTWRVRLRAAQICSWDILEWAQFYWWQAAGVPPSIGLFLCTKGAWRPGVLLAIREFTASAACHSCREPDIPWWYRCGEAPSRRCHEEHQAVAGRPDGELQGSLVGMQAGRAATSKQSGKICPFVLNLWIFPCVQVLFYSGQLDVIVAAPLTERFLLTVNWTGAADYKTAPRFHWRVQPSDTEVAGYVRQVKEFYQVSRYQVQQSEECHCFLIDNSFFFCHVDHHPWRWTHPSLWPTGKVIWHDRQIPLDAGLVVNVLFVPFEAHPLLINTWIRWISLL